MKRMAVFLVLIVLMFFSACMKEVGSAVAPSELSLKELEGVYELIDDRTYGAWTFKVPATGLESKIELAEEMTLETGGVNYLLRPNRFKRDQYFCLLPEACEELTIKNGKIKTGYTTSSSTARENGDIEIYSFYIVKEPGENGTTLYEIGYEMYMEMKAAKHPFIYNNGKLIRPSYIKSSEGYVYEKQMYYNGRQLSPSHDVNGAFSFLQNHDDHETFLFWTNPNTIRLEGDNVVVSAPDTRERVRDLGTMGEISSNAYNVTDTPAASKLTLAINKSQLNQEKYGSYTSFYISLRGATECGPALETQTQGIYELDIPYATTNSIDLIRNARVVTATPITVEPITPVEGTAFETDAITFTWEATESFPNASGARIPSGISHYVFYLKKGEGAYATETVNEKTIQKTLDYASDYTWRVEAIGNNSDITDLSQEVNFSIKYRVRDLGEGNYTLFDDFGEYSLWFSKADLPDVFQSGEEFRVKLNGQYLLFEEIAAGIYRMTIPYDGGVPSEEDVKDAIFEIHKAFRVVQDGVSTGYDTMVEAINSVPRNGKGEIYIASESTITHTNYFIIYQQELTIQPETGFGPIIFDGENSHNQFSLSASASVTFKDLVMVNGLGNGDDGGAIDNQSSDLFVYNCEFRNNTSSQSGGAIRASGINNDPQYVRRLVVENSTITNNHADDSGGGISSRYNQVEISNTLIASNTTTLENTNYGGGMYLFSGSATLSNVDLLYNSGPNGGAMYVYMYDEGNSLTIQDCLIDSNYGSSGAGGIKFSGAKTPFEMRNTVISNNLCASGAGGLSLYHGDIMTNGNQWTNLTRDDHYIWHVVNNNCSIASDGTFNTVYNELDSVLFKDNKEAPSTLYQFTYRLEEE